MKRSTKVIAIISFSLAGFLIGFFLSDISRSELKKDNNLLLQVLERHDKIKSVLNEVDEETRYLYKRIGKTLKDNPNVGCGDSIIDLLHHTSGVINKCTDMGSLIKEVHARDSVDIEKFKGSK